jgi:hypothetical protein
MGYPRVAARVVGAHEPTRDPLLRPSVCGVVRVDSHLLIDHLKAVRPKKVDFELVTPVDGGQASAPRSHVATRVEAVCA